MNVIIDIVGLHLPFCDFFSTSIGFFCSSQFSFTIFFNGCCKDYSVHLNLLQVNINIIPMKCRTFVPLQLHSFCPPLPIIMWYVICYIYVYDKPKSTVL